MKKCARCEQDKPLEAYSRNRARKDGREPYCKPCVSERRGYGKPKTQPAEPVDPLQAAHAEVADRKARAHLNAQRTALVEENQRLKALLDALKPLHQTSPVAIPAGPAPEPSEAVPLILISDWHVEEEVDPLKMHGINAFNLEIAAERSRKFFENSLRLIQLTARDSLIKRVVVGLLGDLFSNSIHPELMEINQLGPQPAARFAKDLLVGGIQYWLANTDLNFEFNCVGGNHGRMTERTRISTNAENSLEVFAYHFLAAEFKNEPRVTFRIAPGDMVYSRIFPDYTVRFIHGDQISYGGGVGGVTIPLRKWISRQDKSIRADLTCLGHFHQLLDGGDFLLNGSLIGPSPYSQRYGFSPEPPAQQFALIHSRGGGCKSIVAPIWVS